VSDEMRDALEDVLNAWRTPPPGWTGEWDETRRPPGWTAEMERAARAARNGPRPSGTNTRRSDHSWREQDIVALGDAKPQPPAIGGLF
jgi:hypothetical protein